jgi:KUP system potassium uptake protein
VLGAVEGLEVATPLFSGYVVPITVAILVAGFSIQKYGTHRVGGWFGPVMILWFVVVAGLGVGWIVREPAVLAALRTRAGAGFAPRPGRRAWWLRWAWGGPQAT